MHRESALSLAKSRNHIDVKTEEDVEDEVQKRRHFRLEYPKPDRPTLVFDKQKLEVLDLAERGIKFFCNKKFVPKQDQPIIGKVHFKDGKILPIAGTVLRYELDKDICVMQLTQGIPYTKMMEEQLAILRKYNKSK